MLLIAHSMLVATMLAFQAPASGTGKRDTIAVEARKRGRKHTASMDVGFGDGTDSIGPRRKARRVPVTDEMLRTAFADSGARTLLARARAARMQQDSSLASYDAKAYSRISAGMGFSRIGRDRLIFRTETSARVRYVRGQGVWVDITGARTAIPIAPAEASDDASANMAGDAAADMSPVPYFPGNDELWFGGSNGALGGGLAKQGVEETQLAHPLASGAEAYYTYASGARATIRLGPEHTIRLRELEIRPRHARFDLVVGSFWFDDSTARLVRAVYRLSEPLDVWKLAQEESAEDPKKDVPKTVMHILSPMTAQLNVVTIEYGLFGSASGSGYWWLPRARSAEGSAQVGFMRVPFKLEENFRYASVDGSIGADTLPVAVERPRRDYGGAASKADSMRVDSTYRATRRQARKAECANNEAERLRGARRFEGTLRVVVRVPCDTARLAHSPDLPPTIFSSTEATFGEGDREALMKELDLGLQPAWSPQRPVIDYGLRYTRYNRVEGLSPAVVATENFGMGYTGQLLARIGTADLVPNAELTGARADGRHSLHVAAYHRLAAANDWGDPLGFGASVSALLLGRDDGFYYRTTGVEFGGDGAGSPFFSWRVFGERQGSARRETDFSVARLTSGTRFRPNIVATRGNAVGSEFHIHHSYGLDPHGFRLLSDVRAEGAGGDFVYTRGAADVTASHGLGRWLDGAITVGGGSSTGLLPVQRLWYLGGTQSIRGQPAGAAVGDAYWMGHAELGYSFITARPVAFTDFGWAGDRTQWRHPGLPLSGAGIGASIMDGLIRFDVSKGINPTRGVRGDLYVESRF